MPTTPLYVAAFNNLPEAAIMLLKHGANKEVQVNHIDATQMALSKNHMKVAEILSQGVEVFCNNLSGEDAHFAEFC
jgi:hypothetical protein